VKWKLNGAPRLDAKESGGGESMRLVAAKIEKGLTRKEDLY